jgi:hypothetical protein
MSEKPRNDQLPWNDIITEALPVLKKVIEVGKKHGYGMDVCLQRKTDQERLRHILTHLKSRFNKGRELDEDDKSNLGSVVVWCMIQMAVDKRR